MSSAPERSSAPDVSTARIGRQKAVTLGDGGAPEAPKAEQSLGARIAARAGGGVMRVFLILVALFWLMPTIGLLLSSLRGPQDIAATGWWKIFTAPSELTFENYQRLLDNSTITGSLGSTIMITVPSTVLVVLIGSFAGYAFAWMEFPAGTGSSCWSSGCSWCRCRSR